MNDKQAKKIVIAMDLFELLISLVMKAIHRNHSPEEIHGFINQVRSSAETID